MPGKNKIYLFIADKSSFTNEHIKTYLIYAQAFFHGVAAVEVIRAGDLIPGHGGKRIPTDFLEKEI